MVKAVRIGADRVQYLTMIARPEQVLEKGDGCFCTVAIVAVLVWLLGAVLNRLISALRGKQPSAPRRFYRDFWANAVSTLLGLKATSHE